MVGVMFNGVEESLLSFPDFFSNRHLSLSHGMIYVMFTVP